MSFRRQNSKLLFESPSVASGEEPDLSRFDFDFERKLGDGAFGQVWRVRHKKTNQVYALKQVLKDKVSKMLPQFRREVYIMYGINHPHIIKLYNHFEDEKFFYLIMELADGNLFRKIYREKQFLERVAAQYFREVLLAVEYLHSHIPAIIHRDIKPENILLDSEGRIKLTDFGWSNYYSTDSPTPRFTTCGTLEYLPPEMVEEKGHDTSADIWCLGILLYEMLIGSTPFKSTIREQMLVNITSSKPRFPLTMPPLAKDLISKMLEKDPSRRPTAIKIKEHQWMIDHAPIRPTITQELSPRVLPEMSSPKEVTGYIVINKNTSVKENDILKSPGSARKDNKDFMIGEDSPSIIETQEIHTVLNPYRNSIKQIKDELEGNNKEAANTRKIIQEKIKEIQKLEVIVKRMEEKVNLKRKDLAALVITEKDTNLQISDVNIDLEKLMKYYNSHNLTEKVNLKSMEVMEKSSEQKKLQNYLSTLREDSKKLTQNGNEKEKLLTSLQNQLRGLKNESNMEIKEKNLRLADKKISHEVLKSRISNRGRVSKEFGNEEKKSVEEIKKIISNLINIPNYIQRLEELALVSQEKNIEKEQDLSNLSYQYEERRSQILQSHRINKDTIQRKLRQRAQLGESSEKESNFTDIQELKIEIQKSRKLAIEYSVPEGEMEKVNKQVLVIYI